MNKKALLLMIAVPVVLLGAAYFVPEEWEGVRLFCGLLGFFALIIVGNVLIGLTEPPPPPGWRR